MITKKNYLFLGFALPDKIMKKAFENDKFPQVQTHTFNWNLIKGIEKDSRIDITYISSRAVTEYPSHSSLLIKGNVWSEKVGEKKISIQEIPFINKGLLKILTKFFSTLYYSFKNYSFKRKKAGIIVYSVHIPYMLAGLLLSKFFRIPLISIWTDPPSVIRQDENKIRRLIRGIEFALSKMIMKKSNKVIALTKYLAEDFAPNKEFIVVEGIVDVEDFSRSDDLVNKKSSSVTNIVYTGSLEQRYGISNIVSALELVKRTDIVLDIYGRGDYEEELIKRIEHSQNINYKGYISRDKILDVQRNADFLINARDDKQDFVKYSFPSKTLEYMLSGTPIITTLLPGIPKEYEDFLIALEDNDPKTIAEEIEKAIAYPEEYIMELGIRAKKFAETKNYNLQGKKIVDFIVS